ncbi:MAG: LPS assembly lipoprotein LptE [Proteobacteria bacterium]|nr:LPS assembly lipoprotein LptE [Pseudomonadota bacterium]
MKNILIISVFSLSLLACGYQLKQPVILDKAYDNTYLNLSISSPLYRPLMNALIDQGIKTTSSVDQSGAQIMIQTNQMKKVIQSIGANNRVQEYRIEYTVVFSVSFGDKLVIDSKRLSQSRDYAFDIGQITGARQEELLLREQLYKDMASRIIRTISQQK